MAGGIRINLDNASKEQLLNEVQQLKNKLQENDIKVKLDFDDGNINSIKDLVKNLQEQVKAMPLKLTIDDVNTQEKLSQIKGSFDKLKEAYDKLGTIKISKTFDDEGQLQSFVVNLEKMNGVIDKIKYRTAGAGIFEFAGGSQVDNINKTTQALEQFRSKWQSTLNEISGKGLIDNSTIQRTQEELNKLNLNNFKESSASVKESINGLTSETNRLIKEQENLANAMGKVHEKSEQNIVKRQQTEQDAYNKSLEQEAIDRQKIQDAIAQTIAKREQENKVLEQNQAKAVNQALEEQYKQEQAEAQRISGLGQNVGSLGSGIGMDSNIKDIQNFLKSTESYKAQITSITEDTDKLGNNVKKVNYTIDEGNNVISKYRLTLDESTGSVYKMTTGIQDLSSKHATFAEQLSNSISAFMRFQVIAAGIVGVINEIKNGISTINSLNESITNISMVTGESISKVQQYMNQYTELSKVLHTTTTDVSNAAEEFLRAGDSQQESMQMVKAATIMAKEAGIGQEEASQGLIAIMNSYQLSASDMMKTVDMLTTADNKSATSVSELNTALQKSASSAKEAGVPLKDLISYIATISSTTRQSSSTIGAGMNSIFSRYESIKMGKDYSPDNEPLNNVEKSLNSVGIAIRQDKDTFKSFSDVIDEVGKKWSTYTDVQKNLIATQMAGTYQRNQFLSLMQNYSEALKLETDLTNSAGSSMSRYSTYAQSTKAKIDDLKGAMERLWQGTLNSETINSVVTSFTKMINALSILTTTEKSSGIALVALSTSMVLVIAKGTELSSVFTKMGTVLGEFLALAAEKGAITALSVGFEGLATSVVGAIGAFITNPIVLFTVALGIATAAVIKHVQHEEEMKSKTDSLKTSYEGLTQAMKDNSSQELKTSLEPLQKQTDELKKLKEQKQELENQISSAGDNDLVKSYAGSKLKDVNEQIADLTKQMKDAGVSMETLSNAQNQLSNINMLQKYQDEANAQVEKNNSLIKEIQEYQELNSVENKNATQKERMTQLSNNLSSSIQGLIISKDKDGNITITNTGLLGKQIDMLNVENSTVQTNAKVKQEEARNNMVWQENETTVTYAEIKKRMQMYQAEAEALQEIAKKGGNQTANGGYTGEEAAERAAGNQVQAAIEQDKLNQLDQIYNATIKTNDATSALTDENNNGYIPSEENATKATKENTAAQKALEATIKAVENQMKSYENQIKAVDNALYSLDSQMQGMDETSDNYINALKEENNMYEQRIGLVNDIVDANGEYIDSIANMGGVSGTALGKEIIQKAESYLNTPYVWGGESPEGFDCSGLVQYVYKQFGIELGRTTYDQIDEGVSIPKQNLQPGDLVFFGDNASSPSHVGIYAGGDEFIESPHTGASVRISNLDNRSDYVGARRVISAQDTGDVIETSSSENSTYSGKYSSYINSAASKYGIPAALIAAVIENESGWTNPSANSAGAIGIMQVTKGSAEDSGYGNANLQDIQTNIMAGSAELARDLQAFDGNLTEAIAAYNAGIGAVQKYGGIPPYSETQNYVPKVLQSYQEYGGSDTVNLSDTATSKIEDILSKNQDYTKQNIDYQRKILENNTKIYEAYMNRYEKELSTNESQLNLDKERYSLYEEGNTKLNDSSRQYMQKEWQDINERYGILIEKQKFIEGELKNNIYDEKTVAQMKQDLQDIQLEETKTVNNLHTAFKDWLADRLTYNTQGYQDNIDMLNAQLDLVNEIDEASNYSSKASYNQQILEQQLKINDALKNQIDFVQKLYDKEQSGNTRLLWSEQLEDLNKQLVESQTNIEKAKKAMEDDVISGILDSVDKKLRLINDDLKDIQSATKDISDSNTSQKLIDNMNILQDQMTILIEDTNAYAELYSQVSADGTITSDEQSKLDSQSDKIRTDKENIQSSVQAINSLNLSNVIQPFENILSSLANNTNALKLQLDMLSSSSTDYATKAGLINEELNNNNLNMENLVSEYNELMNQTATPGTKEADDLTKALETVRDKIGEAAKEGVSLKNSLNDVKLSALFNQIETPQKNINQMLSNMDFVTSMSKAGQTNGLLIGGNYQDTTKNYEDQTLENEQETLDIINDINGKIEDLQSTTYDIDTSDLQNAVTEKIDTTNNLLQSIQDGITNINDNNSKTVETKNVYGTDYDLQYFKEIASKLGISGLFNYVDTNKSEYLDNRNKYKIGSNDIVLGGTGATGGISDSDTTATRLGGVDRSGTQTQIESYLKSLLDVLSNNSGSSNVDTEKTNQELINTLNTGNTTTSAIATNTANDVNAVQEQTTTIISTDNANVANEIATITEQGQNITDGLSTVDTSIDIENSSIESLRTSLTTVLNSILEKINTLDTETSLQELINLHGSVNNIGDLIATVNELSFNPVASVSVKKEEDVNKKATGGTTEGWSIVGDGEGNNAGYELAILPDGRIIPVGQDGWELNKYPEGTQIIKHEDAVKLTGMKDISKYAEGTYKLYAQRADTNAEGLLGDYQYARQLLQTLGRTDIQLVAKDESNWGNRTLGDNDYIIGGSAVIASPEGFDESHRIWGATRKETESALQNFLSNHPMIATSSDINSLGSSNNATKPTSTSTSDYSTSTGSTGTGLSTTSNAGIINEDTETRKQINKNISNIQSAYNEQLSSSISTSELLKNQIALEQQSILLNNDALKQLKDQEILYKDDANALKKIADEESNLNKQIQDSQKKIQDLANSQVEQITAINDAKNKQLETDIKILGNVGNNTSNYQKQLLVLKDINGELLNYQDSLNKINNALTEEQDILNTFNSSNLSANENQSLKNLLLEQAKNGYLNTTDATILSNLETKLSDTDKTTLQGISAVLSAMYSKQFDIQQNITSTRENLISNIQTIITNNFNELEQKYEDAVNEQTEKLSDALTSVQQANNKNEQLATLNKLQTQYNEAINNNSVEGRTQASDLRRQITEQQRKITETNMENMVSNTKTYLSEEVEKRKKIIEDAEKDLSNTMDLIKNGVISADDAITRFKEKWADDIKFLGSNLKINVLDILDQIQNITKDLNLNITTTSTINGEIVTNKIASMDKGGNTGDFNGSSDGKLSILHPEETVLTPFETSDILNTAKILENIKGYDLFTNNLVPSVLKSSDISKLVTTTNSPTGDTNHNYELNFQIANLNGTKNDADMLVNRVYSGIKRIGGDLSKVR